MFLPKNPVSPRHWMNLVWGVMGGGMAYYVCGTEEKFIGIVALLNSLPCKDVRY